MVQIQESGDPTCILDLEITAPAGSLPVCGTFPANESGVDPNLPDNTSN